MTIRIKNKVDYQLDVEGDQVGVVLNNSGQIVDFSVEKYYDVNNPVISSISPIIVSSGINLVLGAECPDLPSPYSYGHFEFVLTYNKDFVLNGALDSDVLYKFESYKLDGWFVERSSIYDFPGAGYTIFYTNPRLTVKMLATNLVLDLSENIYMFSRVRGSGVSGDEIVLSEIYTPWIGKRVVLYSNSFSNTGENRYCQAIVNLLPGVGSINDTTWPSGKTVNYEIYIGSSGYYDDYVSGRVTPEVYRNSLLDPSGFFYFNGTSMKLFVYGGISSSYVGNKMIFVTDEVDMKKAMFAVYKASWSGGNTGWISQSVCANDMVVESDKIYNPSFDICIPKNTFGSFYGLHVIIGTSHNLLDYFIDGDTSSFNNIKYDFSGLIDYSTTLRETDRERFFYYDGIGSVINPESSTFDNTMDLLVTYNTKQNVVTDDKIYMFYRAEY